MSIYNLKPAFQLSGEGNSKVLEPQGLSVKWDRENRYTESLYTGEKIDKANLCT